MSPSHQPAVSSVATGGRWLHHLAIWLIATLLFVAVWWQCLALIENDRARTREAAESDIVNLARVSQEHAERTFASIDQVLRLVLWEYRDHAGNIDLKAMADQGLFDSRILVQLSVVDVQGILRLSSLPFSGRIDLSDREHFTAHLAGDKDVLFISRPVLGRSSGKWSIQLSRRITDKDGQFGGVVVASLDPSYFTRFYGELNLGDRGVATLFGTDGAVRARRVGHQEHFTGDLSSSPAIVRWSQGEQTATYVNPGVIDGIERILHYRKLPSYPMLIAIGADSKDVFADHVLIKANLQWQAGIASLLLLAIAVLASWYEVARRRHSQLQSEALALLQNTTSRVPGVVYQYVLRPDGTSCFPFASAGIKEIYGVSPEEVTGDASRVFSLISPEDVAGVVASIKESARTLTQWVHEYRVRLDDGQIRWLSGAAAPQKLDDGSVLWNGFISDVTERKHQDAKLESHQASLQATFEAIPDLLFEVDLTGRIHAYHSPRTDLLVVPPEAFLGKLMSDFVPPEVTEILTSALQEANALGHSSGKQYELDLPHGRKTFELSVAHKATVQGEEPRFVVLARDVTERKLLEAQQRIAASAFESHEGMFITDGKGVILRVNHAFSRITGYAAAEAVGKTPRLLSSGRHDAAFYAAMRTSLDDAGAWQGEIWNRRKNGEIYPEWLTITAVKDERQVVTHYVSTLTDITARKLAEDQIKHLAFYDPLTGLPNRRLLLDRLQHALASSKRYHRNGALLFIDLDHFKNLNDTQGHGQGDLMLRQVAERLNYCVREGDTVARLGSDEFVVMLQDLKDNRTEAGGQAEAVGEQIVSALGQSYPLDQFTHHCSASVGITLFNGSSFLVEDLLKRADLALHKAKDAGGNTLRFFDPEMQASLTARAQLEADLRQGLDLDQFLLYYQPQVDQEGRLTGVEALVRWQHPLRGMVSPADFIPLAEETRLILPLGQWVLETACHQLTVWSAVPHMAQLTISVNVSALQFLGEQFVEDVVATIARTGAPINRLKLELTESLLVNDVDDIIAKMLALKARGVGFSLDDFGTGYSSLSYLKRLPLDQLKIDQSFLYEALSNPKDAAIVRATIALGNSLGMMVIAEGVETQTQRDFLLGEGCHHFQGYYFGRPGPVADLDKFFDR
jgi:diguanylate cyclase (GGDEF)-like protein/PAS domain S-box-containing protein